LTESFEDIEELGRSYINFNFDTYFQLLDKFHHEFQADPYLGKFLSGLIENCKKGSMITYITPYKNQVNLREMATSFGMSVEDVEYLVSTLIMEGDIKA